MSYEDVSEVLRQVMDIAEKESIFTINEIEHTLNDGLFALEYNPRGTFDEVLSFRITRWIELNWAKGNRSFIDGAIGLYINFASNSASKKFFTSKLRTDHRSFVQQELRDALQNDL